MSNDLAVATTTAAIRYIIMGAVAELGAAVTTQRPDAPSEAAGARVNVFLYQTAPDAEFRNQDLPMRDASGRLVQRPMEAVDLQYLITFYGDEAALMPQRLMNRTLARLHSEAVLTPALLDAAIRSETSVNLSGSDLARQPVLVRLALKTLSNDELNRLWTAFTHGPYGLSVAYEAGPLLLDDLGVPTVAVPVERAAVRLVVERPPLLSAATYPGAGDPPGLELLGTSLAVPRPQARFVQAERETEVLLDPSLDETRLRVPGSELGFLRYGRLGARLVSLSGDEPPLPLLRSNVIEALIRPAMSRLEYAAGSIEAEVGLTVDPLQTVVLLLRREEPPARSYRLAGEARVSPTTHLRFGAAAVEPGRYLAFIEVDGAGSTLASPSHEVVIPAEARA